MENEEINYARLYYFLFNEITDLIQRLREEEFDREELLRVLIKMQRDAEERFIG